MNRLREPEDDEDTLAQEKCPPQSAQSLFEHLPLDLKTPSIRLVRILPEPSSEGYIQLEIRHVSTQSTYVCLSYVWGGEENPRWVRLGGRLFQVRQNLHAFLASASKKPHICSEWLWIDALCIDQSNNSERSHQVQQMANIFSNAIKVISWFGDDQVIAHYLSLSFPPLKLNRLYFIEEDRSKWGSFEWRFLESDYWRRAWITQEVSLARRVTFMAGREQIDRWQPPEDVLGFWMNKPESAQNIAASPENNSHQWRGRSLIYLLELFSRKKCQNRFDRIFSLLGLCGEGSDLEVDYGISRHDLAKRVLQACSSSFCLCAVRLLEGVLNLAEANTAVIEKQLFATHSLSLPLDFVEYQDPMAARIDMDILCLSFPGEIIVKISRGICYRVHDIDDGFILYYNECNIVIDSQILHYKSQDIAWGDSVSYDRDAETWDITFSFAALVELARLGEMKPLCTRGTGATAASVETGYEPLRMSSGSDLYTDAPDLSLPLPDNPPQPSPEYLRSFEVRPYVNNDGLPRYCGVFVYDREDSEDAA
ncbi:hypothetical protein AA0113_g10741 [Alternaria arborescens]|uniref:Heterokaryon incompatibility domain-containing protein n=1 Tax=Alternaria arborescens TaxID=156630 RepID=A0A4Q4QN20_9PLEO|nr:hypothetical protein AA0113_g10741 [Alternaria arborescens]